VLYELGAQRGLASSEFVQAELECGKARSSCRQFTLGNWLWHDSHMSAHRLKIVGTSTIGLADIGPFIGKFLIDQNPNVGVRQGTI